MISRELIEKINRLWHKQQSVGLTEEEKKEQQEARQEYLAAIRSQVKDMLDSITKPEHKEKHPHSQGCSCTHCKH